MSTLGFDNYVEPLKLYLQKYRESMKGEKSISTCQQPLILPDDLEDGSIDLINPGSRKQLAPSQTLTAAMMTDQSGQNVIYTTSYPAQDLNLLLYNNQS
ncbi:hypothetical protein AVEN_207474-1 [Araneus ventricosus]|uniref:Nuclear transcription factor Y subunit beta n=1 Tax=Araneus ventricosus TaxID=182803 RepID=A0A4Y2EDE6_ARAVE|nr:hypothetical protein AVEN_207474-1 [Araneus ventricosus]